MKIAIIGANGFIGNRLLEALVLDPDSPHTPIPIVRQPSSLAPPARFQLDWRIADALDANSLATGLQGCDTVVHAAIGDPVQIEQMPAILCTAAKRAGISRIVYLSSASVHGQNIPATTSESSPLHTRHALDYNNAKVRAERSLFQQAAQSHLQVIALRPGIVFGPRSRWISDTAEDLCANTAWLFDHGQGICNSIYVDNLVHAILLALESPASLTNKAYLVGDTETITWADFYEPIAHALEIDPAKIHQLDTLPEFPRTTRQRIEGAIAKPWAQKLLPVFPHRLKQTTKKILSTLNSPPRADSWALPETPLPRITQELADLQRNRTRLPYDKAIHELGYAPLVSFEEGMRRSLEWLAFARPDYFRHALA